MIHEPNALVTTQPPEVPALRSGWATSKTLGFALVATGGMLVLAWSGFLVYAVVQLTHWLLA